MSILLSLLHNFTPMEATLPWMQIFIMTIVSWIGGALWFGPLFGKVWMKIHHGDKTLSK